MQNIELEELEEILTGIKIVRRNFHIFRYADSTFLIAGNKGDFKEFLIEGESPKVSLLLSVKSSPLPAT